MPQIEFDGPQRAVTKGQANLFYVDDVFTLINITF